MPEAQDLALCPRCNVVMDQARVRTAVWQGERLAVVEDIPAHVCPNCLEQYYDDDVSDALRRLNEEGFPTASAEKTVTVPVFSLEGRLRKRAALPEDTYVD
jgi:YgiT-type zinc finger domain-containing protein